MVRSLVLVAIASLGAVLTGCPDDVGKDLHPTVAGLLAPSLLEGRAASGLEIALTWDDRATTENGYRLEISDSPFAFGMPLGHTILPANSTSTSYATLPGRSYYFRIFAVTQTKESEPSNEIVVTTPEIRPGRPDILSIFADWSTVILSWTNVEGESGYQIELSTDGVQWSPLALSIPAEAVSAAFAPAPGVHQYWVRIYALGPYGNSAPSDVWVVPIPPK